MRVRARTLTLATLTLTLSLTLALTLTLTLALALTWPLTLALGLSALHMLVKAGHLAGAALLLGAGADPNQRAAPARDEYTSGQRGARGG
mgnify:CR=1 FL=1